MVELDEFTKILLKLDGLVSWQEGKGDCCCEGLTNCSGSFVIGTNGKEYCVVCTYHLNAIPWAIGWGEWSGG